MKKITPDGHLTTGQVARICRVAPRTVSKWVDAGLMPGSYRVPNPGGPEADRRVPADVLVRFLRARGIPVPRELLAGGPPLVMAGAVADDRPFLDAVRGVCPDAPVWSGGLVELAAEASARPPAAVLLGPGEGLATAARVARVLLALDPRPAVAVILAEDADPYDPRLNGIRSGFCFLGMTPPTWQEVVTSMKLTRTADGHEEAAGAAEGRAR